MTMNVTMAPLSKVACVVALAAAAAAARADPGYYVVTAYDNAGLHTAELRYWTVARRNRPEMVWPEAGFSYGINSRWTTALLASWIGSSQQPTTLSTLNWSNDVLLTQGEWPVDVAMHVQWIDDRSGAGQNALEFGPVLQTDFGRTQANLNLFLDRPLGHAAAEPTQLKYQWQLRHRWRPWLHFGLQGFGELGDWNDWAPHARQSHRAGPALFGTWHLSDREALKFSAAWLQGRTYGHSGHMLSLRAAYEF